MLTFMRLQFTQQHERRSHEDQSGAMQWAQEGAGISYALRQLQFDIGNNATIHG